MPWMLTHWPSSSPVRSRSKLLCEGSGSGPSPITLILGRSTMGANSPAPVSPSMSNSSPARSESPGVCGVDVDGTTRIVNKKITELRIKKHDNGSQLNRIGTVCFRGRQTADFRSLRYEAGKSLAKRRHTGEAERREDSGKRDRREATPRLTHTGSWCLSTPRSSAQPSAAGGP
jgi:hypothetical protein